jgi:hypothetical protein
MAGEAAAGTVSAEAVVEGICVIGIDAVASYT